MEPRDRKAMGWDLPPGVSTNDLDPGGDEWHEGDECMVCGEPISEDGECRCDDAEPRYTRDADDELRYRRELADYGENW